MKLGEKIKAKRLELGWSQRELSARMGYKDHSTVAKIEQGKVDVPQSKMVKFSQVLGVSLSYLLGTEEVESCTGKNEAAILDSVEDLFDYITASPVAPHAICETAKRLENAGYVELKEHTSWQISFGGSYYVRRSTGAIIAFRMPSKVPTGAMMVATHSDSPTFAITPSLTAKGANYTRLTTEKYGGMLCATWLDRPLSVAGVLVVKGEKGQFITTPVKVDKDLVIIPSVAIHMNRNANDGATYNPAVDMQPLWGGKETRGLMSVVAEASGVREEDIVSQNLWLYNRQAPAILGGNEEFIAAPRLDDLACAYGALVGFLQSTPCDAMPVYALFDHEEVGSTSTGGAGGDFLAATLRRACLAVGMKEEEMASFMAQSLMISADNAHAIHPNHPEYADANNAPKINGGVVIKHNANRRYATDAIGDALFSEICKRAGAPTQTYCNRPDIPGGSTLGCVSIGQVTVPTVDIGLAQLAMHSSYETMGKEDVLHLINALRTLYSTSISLSETGDIYLR